MPEQFTYLAHPSAYIIETSKRSYMVVEGHATRSLSRKGAGQIRSRLKSKHDDHKKCSKHRSQAARRFQKSPQKEGRNECSGRTVSFNEYGLRPNCNYDTQLHDQNQCLRTENKCLQQYIRVLEERCNNTLKPQAPKTVVYEANRKRASSRQGSLFDQNKMFSTKGTASWISYQN